ncbi:MAG TPA: glycerophosphodiester phosphodiesterase family protein [Verrucomicrobiae bacterium]|nr:glycerophosphodiester phosphodiesterase family protein [Verrucomicrobiae bacterium]
MRKAPGIKPKKASRISKRAPRLYKRPLIIGHRGFSEIAPENTLPSFRLALKAGADFVELDYQETRDGVAVVFHDATLDRTTDVRKRWSGRRFKVSEHTAAQIRNLDAGSWFGPAFAGTPVPRLSEAVCTIVRGGGRAVIERKSGSAARCVKLLARRAIIKQCILISFDWSFLAEVHALNDGIRLGALGPPSRLANGKKRSFKHWPPGRSCLQDLQRTGASILVWNARISGNVVKMVHAAGFQVWVYTVDNRSTAARMMRAGVDGLITNRVEFISKTMHSFC